MTAKRITNRWRPEYGVWNTMIQRCTNPAVTKYASYGARGIIVCERWRTFENFFEDMGIRPSPKHSIDRIDNNGNYEPGNCRWAVATAQARNRRSNRLIEFNGETKCLAEWAEQYGLQAPTLNVRLQCGMSIGDALTRPVGRRTAFTIDGETKTLTEWAKQYGFTCQQVCNRLIRGWTIEKALMTPIDITKRNKK